MIGAIVILVLLLLAWLLPDPRRNDGGIREGLVKKGGLNPKPKTPPPPPPVGQGGAAMRWKDNQGVPEGFYKKDGSMKFPHGSTKKNPFLEGR